MKLRALHGAAGLLLVLAMAACGRPPLEARAPTPGVPHLTVKTYNVEAGKHRDPSIIEAVGVGAPDIVCLQETTPEYEAALRQRFSKQLPHQLYQHNAPNMGASGLAVLSRYEVIDRGFHPSPFGWHPAWYVEVTTPGGPVQILNLHLRAKLSGRGGALTALLSLGNDHRREIEHYMQHAAAGKPTLVVGDFNEGVGGSAVTYLKDRGFENALPLFEPGKHTWRHPLLVQTLDHILFDGSFVPLDATVIEAGRSDHLPVVAQLELAQN